MENQHRGLGTCLWAPHKVLMNRKAEGGMTRGMAEGKSKKFNLMVHITSEPPARLAHEGMGLTERDVLYF